MTKEKLNRRQFIQQSAATTGGATILLGTSKRTEASFNPQESANSKIRLGFIGVGARAQQVIEDVKKVPGFEIVGMCDAYKGRLERATERTGGKAKVFANTQELLAAPGIDAVYIGTPDHWHKDHAIAALNAGKDVYLEKPLTYTIEEGHEIAAAVATSQRILQVGSQPISAPIQQKAREIVQSGRLGQVTMVRISVNRNTPGGAWIYPIPPDANQATVNWDMFLGKAPKRMFSLERFFRWRCYEDYSGGMATDLFVHAMTSLHFIMGAQAPDTVFAAGSLYRWKGSRDVPDTLDAILQYPEGFTVNLSGTFNNQSAGDRGIQILGTQGSLTLGRELVFAPERVVDGNDWIVDSWPSALQRDYYKNPKVIAAERPDRWASQVVAGEERWANQGPDADVLHWQNFERCVRERKQPIEDVWAGHRAAAVPHMINLSAKRKAPVYWDRNNNRLKA